MGKDAYTGVSQEMILAFSYISAFLSLLLCISFTVLEQFMKVVWYWTFLMSGLDDKKLVALVNTDIINNILNLLMANT